MSIRRPRSRNFCHWKTMRAADGRSIPSDREITDSSMAVAQRRRMLDPVGDGKTWPVRKLLTPGQGEWDGGAHTKKFIAAPTRAEHAGYLAATQTPDNAIHLISSRLHYRFNLAWLTAGT